MAGDAGCRRLTRLATYTPAARLQAQTVLANLFLDTEFSPQERRIMVARLEGTGIPVAELEAILRHEVAPIFGSNLLSIAGEWTYWEETDVADLIGKHLQSGRRAPWSKRLIGKISLPLALPEWREWRRLLQARANI